MKMMGRFYKFLSLSCLLAMCFFCVPLAIAQASATSNICAQSQCVKIQNGNLWVLSADNVTYTPYFIKGVGYQPTPIGRYPSDWGYPLTDPRVTHNNIFDDPDILNRDFSLLQQMNANTVRIWSGNKMTVSCPCANNGRFTSYMTNAGTTANPVTTQNTLDLAASYGLKVIAGFGVNYLTFDANNNIGSFDNNGNPLTRQGIINNFVSYVNTFKANRAILFWAIGNENNTETVNSSVVTIAAFENAFGLSEGDAIYNWLREVGNVLDYNGDIIVDLSAPATTSLIAQQYPSEYNSILNLLKQFSGQRLTPQQLTAWYSLVDAMAKAAHQAEGSTFHPVAVVNAGVAEIGNAADGATDAQLPDLDIWGANVYQGKSFGDLFSNYGAQSHKPLWISEFGIDAWSVTNAAGVNDWGMTLASDLGGMGGYDAASQSQYDGGLWNEILNNSSITIGGSVMEYSDEWWKPSEWYCTNTSLPQSSNAVSAGICNSNHKYFGFPNSAFPDNFSNEEWYGVMSISPNPVIGDPDVMAPRPVYYQLQSQWQANPWPLITLNLSGLGAGNIVASSTVGAGLSCNYVLNSSKGSCSSLFTKNQPVTLTFSSSNKSTVTNWGIGGCVSGASSCTVTPDTNIILNVTVSAPSCAGGQTYNGIMCSCPTNMGMPPGNNSSCQCYAGTYYVSSSAGCAYCPVGKISNDGKTCVPITCPANMYFDITPGTSGYNSCQCDQYTYWNGSSCSYCPTGQTSTDGKTCTPIICPANMYYDVTSYSCQCYYGTVYVGPGCAYLARVK